MKNLTTIILILIGLTAIGQVKKQKAPQDTVEWQFRVLPFESPMPFLTIKRFTNTQNINGAIGIDSVLLIFDKRKSYWLNDTTLIIKN